jgi:3D (Asp-Asp-Asp) domain-containing protein
MFWLIFWILLTLGFWGMITSHTLGGCRRRSRLRFAAALFGLVGAVLVSAPDSWGMEARRTWVKALPPPGLSVHFQATAYCKHGITRSGSESAPGIVAADPRILPLGSIVEVDTPSYGGIYHVMDTGRMIKGRRIDIFVRNRKSAMKFGRRTVKLTLLRPGPGRPHRA